MGPFGYGRKLRLASMVASDYIPPHEIASFWIVWSAAGRSFGLAETFLAVILSVMVATFAIGIVFAPGVTRPLARHLPCIVIEHAAPIE